jgi:hypothetical protein
MQVHFNNLRRTVINDYNELVKKAMNVDNFPEEAYDEIRPYLINLRNSLAILACIYDTEQGIVSLADEIILVPQ